MRLALTTMTLGAALGLISLTGCETHVVTDNPPDLDVEVQKPPVVDVDVTPKPTDVNVKVD